MKDLTVETYYGDIETINLFDKEELYYLDSLFVNGEIKNILQPKNLGIKGLETLIEQDVFHNILDNIQMPAKTEETIHDIIVQLKDEKIEVLATCESVDMAILETIINDNNVAKIIYPSNLNQDDLKNIIDLVITHDMMKYEVKGNDVIKKDIEPLTITTKAIKALRKKESTINKLAKYKEKINKEDNKLGDKPKAKKVDREME